MSVTFVLGLELSKRKTARAWTKTETKTKNKIFILLCQSQGPERAPHKRPITKAV